MLLTAAADAVLVAHLAFIVFVAGGWLLVARWWRLAWLHLPAVIWGVVLELTGWLCPLTELENRLRLAGGEAGYSGGFIDQYVVPIVYPTTLTRAHQLLLGVALIAVNCAAYAWIVVRRRSAARGHGTGSDRSGRKVKGRRSW